MPALALGIIGLFFGGLLAFASIVFKVEKDERIDKIADALPGANCGGCGYAGCSALAEAIIKDGVRPSKCNLMNEKIANDISNILGTKASIPEKKVARLNCMGTCEVAKSKYIYEGIDDCYALSLLSGGPKACEYGCMGGGSCVKVCKFGALSIQNGIASIDEDKCTGCGMCESVCPKKVIRLQYVKNKVYVACASKDKGVETKNYCQIGCIGCKICEKNCPTGAITVKDNRARIDYSKCTSCGLCAQKCPKKVIIVRN